MLKARLIPCLDVKEGRIVKGVRFSGLRDSGDPVERAALYDRQGADELVLLDVAATTAGSIATLDTVRAVRQVLSIPLTVGGGITSSTQAGELLMAGADKVAVNTAAVTRPPLLSELANRFGRQCCVIAIDAAARAGGGWDVRTHSGQNTAGRDAVDWSRQAVALGAGEILLTSFDRDGTREGYDLDLIRATRETVNVPIIASGGAASAEHMRQALDAGADAVLAASIFHDDNTPVFTMKNRLAGLGIRVRL
jgi:imidazoleglycerol phosphate synthase cyclase subunit